MTERILNDRYALESKVGEGGMAVTYRARDLLLHRVIAIKLMREQFTSDPQFVDRFRHEAQAAARLSHEHIANVYDTGSADGTQYIVMEFVEGTDLKQRLRQEGPLPVLTVLEIGRQIAAALEAAHGKGLVHRDIKPHNILLNREGKVKVTDFGIAKVVSDSEDTGVIIGSVHYLAPEQARGDATTPSSDLYALGCVLFEMLTGRTVFEGENPMAVAHKQIYEHPPHPRSLRPAVPAAVEAVVLRCLEKEPRARYQSATEVRLALTQLINQLTQEETVVIAVPPASDSTIVYQKPLHAAPERPQPVRGNPMPAAAQAEPPPPPSGGARGWIIATLFVALAAVVAYAGFGMFGRGIFPPPPPPPDGLLMPDLVGLDARNAETLLKRRNILYQGDKEWSQTFSKGKVCRQDPPPGTKIDASTTVFYYISKGPQTFAVPDVSQMTIDRAKAEIRIAAGDAEDKLVIFLVKSEESEQIAKSLVIRTEPAAGTTIDRTRDKVTLVVSKGFTPPSPVKEVFDPGLAVDLGGPNTYIKIEYENPRGSAPQLLLTDTFKPGEQIPLQRFERAPQDTVIVRVYGAKDDHSPLEQLSEEIFAPKPSDTAPAAQP